MQHLATFCNILQPYATFWSNLQHCARFLQIFCNILQIFLQHFANFLQHFHKKVLKVNYLQHLQFLANFATILQLFATFCNFLQHFAIILKNFAKKVLSWLFATFSNILQNFCNILQNFCSILQNFCNSFCKCFCKCFCTQDDFVKFPYHFNHSKVYPHEQNSIRKPPIL